MPTEVREIDWAARKIVTSDDRTLPIVDLFDRLGRPLQKPFGAIVAIAGEPGAWVTFKLADFGRNQLQ